MNLYSISLLFFSFGVLLISILTLTKCKDQVALRFFAFSFSVCGWGFLCAFWMSQNYSYTTTLLLVRLGHLFANFIPITWVHFVFEFLERKEPVKHFYLTGYLIAFFFSTLTGSPLYISGLHSIMEIKYFPSVGLVYHFFTSFFLILVPYAFFYLVRSLFIAKGQVRNQLKYFTAATIIGFGTGAITFLTGYKIAFPLFPLVLLPVYPFLMGIALIRYDLFEPQRLADAFQREKLAAIGTLASSLNHELRNPLFIVQGKIESHLDALHKRLYSSSEEEGSKTEETLSAALSQLNRAMDIMQRFSEFAKPLATQNKEKVVISDILEDVFELVAHQFEMRKIKLKVTSMGGLSIFINKRHLEEILFNLIVNACQAVGDVGGELVIRAHQTDRKTCIEISDSGPGILKRYQNRIFEPFYSTKSEKGTGLGLYITKQLVEKNEGRIFVKSKPGYGCSFFIEFSNSMSNERKFEKSPIIRSAYINNTNLITYT